MSDDVDILLVKIKKKLCSQIVVEFYDLKEHLFLQYFNNNI